MYKKLLIIDIISFISSIILLILVKLCYIFTANNLPVSITLTTLAIVIAIVNMLFLYKNDKNKNDKKCPISINIILCIIFFLLLYIIYTLPIFDFIGQKGVNNSVCLVFECLFGSKFLIYLSYVLKSKSVNISFSLNKNSFNLAQNYYKFFSTLGIFVFIGGIIGAIFNIFIPAIDMSVPYQMMILHKSFNEIN